MRLKGFYPKVNLLSMLHDNWARFTSWSLVLPPSRPDQWQLSAISALISLMNRDVPVAVLGSTPEFRDLLAELQFSSVHVFERNRAFYDLTADMRIFDQEEHFVEGDWLDTLHATKFRYGVILSDLTSGNIAYEDRRRFYEGIARVLLPDGLFIDRVLFHPKPHLSIQSLSAKYSELPLNLLTVNHFSCEFLFCSELLALHNRVDSSLFYELLSNQLSSKRLSAFLKACVLITPRDCVWWYGPDWPELSVHYEACLDIKRRIDEPLGSPYFKRAMLFVSRARSSERSRAWVK